MLDMAQIQAFFFKAMMEGYAVGGQKIKIADMPGYKAIPFRDGDFYLLDRYCVTPNSPKSAGTTTIWFQDVPVWVMNYGGYYDDHAIRTLKCALRKAYETQQFIGGRGSRVYTDGSFVYVNHPRRNDFDAFEGRESIINEITGVELGFHQYWGMSLL